MNRDTSNDQVSKPSPKHLVELLIVDDPAGLDIGQAFLRRPLEDRGAGEG